MNVSELFIRRPVGTALLMIGVAVAGVAAYQQLPVSALPQVDYPTIVVSTILPGASADTMVSAVTTPLERQLGQIPSLAHLTSVSSAASSQITLQFTLDRDIDSAEQDVQAAINAASNLLPRTLPTPPTYSKSNPADVPVISLAVRSDTTALSVVDDYADSILAQKLAQVSGVGLVTLNGGQRPAVRVQVDPVALAGRGLGLEDVRAVLALANVNQPKGNLDGPRQNYLVSANDQLASAEGYKPLVLAYQNGAVVRLSDVAKVLDGVENAQLAGWSNEHPAVILNVQRQPGANLIEVAERVKALLPRLEASLPQGITVDILSDRTETVRASVRDVEFTLLLTMILVVAVIYLFLRTMRATIIPGVAVPLSLIATFGVMLFLGYSLNNLTLMALTISTGFVVDDAIVMIENIARHIEAGDAPFTAALKGSKQIGFTIVSLTVSLVAVLIPLLFMGGIIGRLFREFAVTLSTAIVASAIISLTLTAMMCGHILRPIRKEDEGRVARASEAAFDWMVKVYDRGLGWVLNHQALTLAATVATVALTFFLAVVIPKGLFPQQDTGMLLGITEAPIDTSFTAMADRQQAVVDVIRVDPDVENVASFIGADGTNPTLSSGRLSITLKNREQRKSDAQAIIDRLSAKLAQVTGMTVYLQAVQDLQLSSQVSRTQYQYTIEDADPSELATWAPQVLARLKQIPELDRRRQRSTERRAADDAGHRPRQRFADGDHRAGHRRHALRRLRAASGVDDLHPAQSLPRDPGGLAPVPVEPRRPQPDLHAGDDRPDRAALGLRALPADADGGLHRARGTISGGHALLQSGAGRRAGRRGAGHQGRRGGDERAGRPARRLPGRRRRLRRLAVDGAAPHPGRDRHRLHRARRPLRELHPPHHDPLDAAVGRRGRLPGAACSVAPSSRSSPSSGSSCSSGSSRRTPS